MTLPFVSVLLVARNERKHIATAMNAVFQQNYPIDRMELIVVDGMSEDGSFELAEKIASQTQIKMKTRVIQNPNRILASGWNFGIKESIGDVVCRFDVHGWPEPDYISRGVEELEKRSEQKVVCVGGVLSNEGEGFLGKLIATIMGCPFGVGNSPFRLASAGGGISDTAAMGIYRKEIFFTVGYFREDLARNQDLDMHTRIRDLGFNFYTSPKMVFHYIVRNSIKSFLSKAFGDGFWIGFMRNGFLRHWIPGLFCIYTFFLPILCRRRSQGLLLPAYSYFALNGLFSLLYGRSFQIIFLPLLFFFLHLCYGFGTLCGLLQSIFKVSKIKETALEK